MKNLFLIIVFILASYRGATQTSFLDPTFGNSGIFIHNFYDLNLAYDAVMQPDGKILIGGWCGVSGMVYTRNLAIARYTVDGAIDNTFSGNGIDSVDQAGNDDWGYRIALGDSGRILLAGRSDVPAANAYILLSCYFPNGDPDTTFGVNGRVIHSAGSAYPVIRALAIGPSGEIYFGGFVPDFGIETAFVMKLHPDGSVDSTFGANGVVMAGGGNDEIFMDLLVQPDGKVLAAGSTNNSVFLTRFNSAGIPDTTFNNNGIIIDSLAGTRGFEIVRYANGSILVSCINQSLQSNISLVRYLTDGTPDSSFGTNGRLHTTLETSFATGPEITLTPAELLLVTSVHSGLYQEVKLNCFYPDGSPVLSFGINGSITNSFGPHNSYPSGVMMQPSGTIVIAGGAMVNTTTLGDDFALMRYGTNVFTGNQELPGMQDQLSFLPNPVTQTAVCNISNPEKQHIEFMLYDVTGRLIENQNIQENQIVLQVANKRPGLYVFSVKDEQGKASYGRVVIAK